MKIHIAYLLSIGICINASAQNIELKDLLDSVNWNHSTETDLVYNFSDYIEKVKHDEWKVEQSSSDYQFKNIFLGNLKCSSAVIRVNTKSRKFFRANFIFQNIEDYQKNQIYNYLEKYWGSFEIYNENKIENQIFQQDKIWLTKNYLLKVSYMPILKKIIFCIEPLSYYPVSYDKATIKLNTYNIQLPKIEFIAIGNNSVVYIKQHKKEVVIHTPNKIITSTKGNVIFFDDGAVCHRNRDADCVYIKQGFAAIYPINNK